MGRFHIAIVSLALPFALSLVLPFFVWDGKSSRWDYKGLVPPYQLIQVEYK